MLCVSLATKKGECTKAEGKPSAYVHTAHGAEFYYHIELQKQGSDVSKKDT